MAPDFNSYKFLLNLQEASMKNDKSPLVAANKQPSHTLFVLSNAVADRKENFVKWYTQSYHQSIVQLDNVLSAQHYTRHEIDITHGSFPGPSYQYLGVYELCLDGAGQAQEIINTITQSHQQESSAELPATWLYFPISEKVGRSPEIADPMIALAFANGLPGREAEFREWYCTQHMRHALHIPVFASGQCLERTGFQDPGVVSPDYSLICFYQWDGTPQDYFNFLESLSEDEGQELTDLIAFPAMDSERFGEAVYKPITKKLY